MGVGQVEGADPTVHQDAPRSPDEHQAREDGKGAPGRSDSLCKGPVIGAPDVIQERGKLPGPEGGSHSEGLCRHQAEGRGRPGMQGSPGRAVRGEGMGKLCVSKDPSRGMLGMDWRQEIGGWKAGEVSRWGKRRPEVGLCGQRGGDRAERVEGRRANKLYTDLPITEQSLHTVDTS